jgi:hypothetical protein
MVKTFRSAHATGSAPTSSYRFLAEAIGAAKTATVQRLRCAFYSEWAVLSSNQ